MWLNCKLISFRNKNTFHNKRILLSQKLLLSSNLTKSIRTKSMLRKKKTTKRRKIKKSAIKIRKFRRKELRLCNQKRWRYPQALTSTSKVFLSMSQKISSGESLSRRLKVSWDGLPAGMATGQLDLDLLNTNQKQEQTKQWTTLTGLYTISSLWELITG